MKRKYYQILGLEIGASLAEIEIAYKKVMKLHLDKHNNDMLFKKRFQEIQKAYDYLCVHYNEPIENQEDFSHREASQKLNTNLGLVHATYYCLIFILLIAIIPYTFFFTEPIQEVSGFAESLNMANTWLDTLFRFLARVMSVAPYFFGIWVIIGVFLAILESSIQRKINLHDEYFRNK